MSSDSKIIVKLPHHDQQEYCLNRPPYRQGRKLTAVKVYTVNDESQHLLVFGVPQIKLREELYRLARRYGIIKSLTLVHYDQQNDDGDIESRKFTDTYHLHYRRIQAARFAKRQLDERCFFGGVLHVCYAPELETVAETRIKLIQRRREVAARIEANKKSSGTNITKTRVLQRSRKHPALPLTEERLQQCLNEGHLINDYSSLGESTSKRNRTSLPHVLKPSPLLIHGCAAQYEPLSKQYFNTASSSSGFNEQLNHPTSFNTSSTSVPFPVTARGYSLERWSSHCTSKTTTNLQLSDEEKKTLSFIPRQISLPSSSSSSNKNVTKKKIIVFHNKK